ncbi:MAG: NAD-binding protein [Erysipelotrichaceae bacterium]|nr:NAD-binding protein [Erysipelotrichaceae bacterium]
MAVKKVAGPRRYFPKDKWKKKDLQNHTLITGNNSFCLSLAEELIKEKKPVTILCTDVSMLQNIENNSYLRIIQSDQINTDVLQDCIYPSSRVMAISDNDADNILVALMARKKFNIENVFITLKDSQFKILFEDQDITVLGTDNVTEIIEILFPESK